MPFIDRLGALSSLINADTALFVVGFALLVALALIVRLEWRLSKLTRGRHGGSLEDIIKKLNERADESKAFEEDMERYLTAVEKRLRRSIQRVETVRFNPFQGTGEGGNQSFATAFISEDGDGMVLSSIYARDRMSVFAKPVEKKKSKFELTEEEQDVLKAAAEMLEKREG